MAQYLDEVSAEEASCVLRAFLHKTNSVKIESGNYCSHEEDFLSKWNFLAYNYKKEVAKKRKVLPNIIISLKKSVQAQFSEDPSLNCIKNDFYRFFSEIDLAHYLFWLGSVLVNNHEKKDCYKFMLLALKFYLKAIELSRFAYSEDDLEIIDVLDKFLPYIAEFKCRKELFFGYLHVFLCNLSDKSRDVMIDEIVSAGKGIGLNVQSIWKEDKGLLNYKYVEHALCEQPKRFLSLTYNGYVDKRFEGDYKLFKEMLLSIDYEDRFCAEELSLQDTSNIKYRSLQVLHLYALKSYKRFDNDLHAPRALMYLWFTITDPFLTKEQFISCFDFLSVERTRLLRKVWRWYKKTLQISGKSRSSPRTLEYYSICATRRRLAECCQYTDGVKSLPLPDFIKAKVKCILDQRLLNWMPRAYARVATKK